MAGGLEVRLALRKREEEEEEEESKGGEGVGHKTGGREERGERGRRQRKEQDEWGVGNERSGMWDVGCGEWGVGSGEWGMRGVGCGEWGVGRVERGVGSGERGVGRVEAGGIMRHTRRENSHCLRTSDQFPLHSLCSAEVMGVSASACTRPSSPLTTNTPSTLTS